MAETSRGHRRASCHHDRLRHTVAEDVQVPHLDGPPRVALFHRPAGPGEGARHPRGQGGARQVRPAEALRDKLRQL